METTTATKTDIKMTRVTDGFLMEPVSDDGRGFFAKRCGAMCCGITLIPDGLGYFVSECCASDLIIREAR
jgi:hypothetical protein